MNPLDKAVWLTKIKGTTLTVKRHLLLFKPTATERPTLTQLLWDVAPDDLRTLDRSSKHSAVLS